jgi:hypothetical protein
MLKSGVKMAKNHISILIAALLGLGLLVFNEQIIVIIIGFLVIMAGLIALFRALS